MRSENVSRSMQGKEIGDSDVCVTGTAFGDSIVHLRRYLSVPPAQIPFRPTCTQPILINKGKGGPANAMKEHQGRRGKAPLIPLDEGEWLLSCPGLFTHERTPASTEQGDWVCPRDGMGILEKRKCLAPCLDSNPGPSSL